MSEPIPFPGSIKVIGETFSSSVIRSGRAEAERRGIAAIEIDRAIKRDRRCTTYLLGQLGSSASYKQRCGELGLRRFIDSIGSEP